MDIGSYDLYSTTNLEMGRSMEPGREEEKTKLRKEKSKEAIALALKGEWEAAVQANQEILGAFPNDVESLNRLGKAFLELGRYNAARGAFANAVNLSPHNTIAKKNLERLDHLEDSSPQPKLSKVVTPHLLIEESGKSGVTILCKPGDDEVLVKMAAGDGVNLRIVDRSLVIEDCQGHYVGQVEPKLALRLMRLMEAGNRYEAAVISVDRREASIVIWETYHHPNNGASCSFPGRSKAGQSTQLKDAMLRYDIDSEMEEEEEDIAAEWKAGYPESSGLAESEEPMELTYSARKDDSETSEEDS